MQTAVALEDQRGTESPICLHWLLSKLFVGPSLVSVHALYVLPVGFVSHAL